MEFNKAKHEVHLEKWRAIVYECRNSGTPVLAWLKEHGIPQGTYYRWQKVLQIKVKGIEYKLTNC